MRIFRKKDPVHYPDFWKKPPKSPWTPGVRKWLSRVVGRSAHAAVWEAIEHGHRRLTETEAPDLSAYLDLPDKSRLETAYDAVFVSNAMLPPRGGGTRSFLHLAKQLVALGLRVGAVCGGPAIKTFERNGIDFTWVVHEDDLRDAIRRYPFARLLCQQRWAPVAADEAKRVGRPFWYFLRSIEDLTPSRDGVFVVSEIAADIDRASSAGELIAEAECVVANSHFMSGIVKEGYGRECDVVYPGIETPANWETRRTSLSRYIVSMGGSTKKGIQIVLSLARAFPGEQFIVCGVKRLPTTVRPRELPANVSWLGQLDPSAAYALAKVVLMPSLWPEPAGRVCPEALMRGIPVLASRVGGIPEIVVEGRFLVDDFTSPDAWTAGLRGLLKGAERPETRQTALRRGEVYREMQKVPDSLLSRVKAGG